MQKENGEKMLKSLQYGMHGAAWVCEMAEGIFIPTSRREKTKKG